MIAAENVHFAYSGGENVLQGINLEIGDGEFVAIMGENGAGKTTLIKTFNGLLRPTQGRVLIDGADTRKSSVAALSKNIGLVFQNPDHQLFSETVTEELAFSLRNFGYADTVIERRVASLLETLDLTRYSTASPFILSGGERKRVALACVLVWDPKHLVLDEPTIGQDYQQKDRLRNFIKQLNSQGKTVVIVTHDVEFVAESKPRVVLLSHGQIVGDGPCEDIMTNRQLVDQASLVMPQVARLMERLRSEVSVQEKVVDIYTARDFLLKFRRHTS